MRLSEILGLKWENVDLEKQIIIVTRTKNKELRYIDLNESVAKALMEWREISDSDIFVFCDEEGKPFKSIQTAWNRAKALAGVQKTFGFTI
jgi:integrase